MDEFIFATNNQNKVREIEKIFQNVRIVSLAEAGIDVDVEETGSTFEENALIKAREIFKLTRRPTLSDDSGLMVDALGGRPGIYSARYAGVHGDSAANNKKLLGEMENVQNRKAHFVSAVAFVCEGEELVVTGRTEGEILREECGDAGFGFDPLFYSYDLRKSFGCATMDEKNSVSHRARAFNKMKELLKEKNIIS